MIVIAYTCTAYIGMAYRVMAYTVMAYIVMALFVDRIQMDLHQTKGIKSWKLCTPTACNTP